MKSLLRQRRTHGGIDFGKLWGLFKLAIHQDPMEQHSSHSDCGHQQDVQGLLSEQSSCKA